MGHQARSEAAVEPSGAALKGALTAKIDRATFESCASCHKATWTDDKAQVWAGVPLWMLAGYVDDDIKHPAPPSTTRLAKAGYSIDVIAKDGFTVTFESARLARNNNMLVANTVNNNPLPDQYSPLRLVGSDAGKKEMVGAIAGITLTVKALASGAPAATPAPTAVAEATAAPAAAGADVKGDLVIAGAVGNPLGFTEAELRELDVVKIALEHPKQGQQQFEGVRLSTLLALAKPAAGAKTISFVAADGFKAETDLANVQKCTDCLLGFTDTPAKFRLGMPGMASNLWAKELIKIELK